MTTFYQFLISLKIKNYLFLMEWVNMFWIQIHCNEREFKIFSRIVNYLLGFNMSVFYMIWQNWLVKTNQNQKSTERILKKEKGRVAGNDIFPSVDRHAYIKDIKGSKERNKSCILGVLQVWINYMEKNEIILLKLVH